MLGEYDSKCLISISVCTIERIVDQNRAINACLYLEETILGLGGELIEFSGVQLMCFVIVVVAAVREADDERQDDDRHDAN